MTNVNQISDARPCALPRARTSARRAAAATLLLLAATSLGACEGDNLFDGNADDYQPVASISAPDQVVAGETIGIRVDGAAASGVAQLSISMRGIVSRDTVIEMAEDKNSVSTLLPVTIPQALQGTQLLIQAQVIDKAGRFSNIAEKILSASGAPFVQILSMPVSVQPGQFIDLDVAATATEGIDQIAVKFSGAADGDTTVTISPANPDVRQTIRMQVPFDVQDTLLNVTASARDQLGNRGSVVKVVPFVVGPPVVSVTVPDTTWPGARIEVQVQAHALRKLSEIRVELRGAAVIDTVVKLVPERASINDFVAIRLPGDITLPSEGGVPEIRVRAFAMDRSGVVTVSEQHSITVLLDTPVDPQNDEPVIRSVDVYGGGSVIGGHFLDFRIVASGTRPIKTVSVRWTGLQPGELPHTHIDSLTIEPPRLNVTEDVRATAPCLRNTAAVTMLVTVRDESDVLSQLWEQSVVVVADSTCFATDTSGSASLGIAAAPGMQGTLPAVGTFGQRPALLAARPFRLNTAGRRRRAARK